MWEDKSSQQPKAKGYPKSIISIPLSETHKGHPKGRHFQEFKSARYCLM